MNPFDLLTRTNPEYVDQLYRQYKQDPQSVDAHWALIFSGYDFALEGGAGPLTKQFKALKTLQVQAPDRRPIVGADHMVHAYRQYGHLIANLDPLGTSPKQHPWLELEALGISSQELQQAADQHSFLNQESKTIADLRAALHRTYCGSIGVEFVFLREPERWQWLLEQMETTCNKPQLTSEMQKNILRQLVYAEGFEQFLHTKYRAGKRFSLEGSEALIALLEEIIQVASSQSATEIVFGMPHRGRLNVLTHTLRKPYELVFAEFEDIEFPGSIQGAGDVKYHKGFSYDYLTANGQRVHLSLSANPSHLEAISPAVLGNVRAKQDRFGKDERQKKVVPVLMHGDAAFAAQGVVYETLAISGLKGFNVGGSIHIIINNQVGFTTNPSEGRSTYYASDVARMLRAPVFHVNADDPEAVVHVARLATAYRQRFQTDVFIDLVCYRRHGHNELDDPTFTQPKMYHAIAAQPTVAQRYAQQLIEQGVINASDVEAMRQQQRQKLDVALERAKSGGELNVEDVPFRGLWQGFNWSTSTDQHAKTRVAAKRLQEIATQLAKLPAEFTPHPRLPKHFEQLRDVVVAQKNIPWAAGEALAYGSLLIDQIPVRLVGQDSGRGTFSHRHAILSDHQTGEHYIALNHLVPEQARIEIINSPLSEMAVLGFEYGVAAANPHRLVIWEAQFGDFANEAQVIIDQFIVSGESKWQRQCGLVLLLPHGHEGQGPEHSSARPERFLQLAAEDNIQVVDCTTPAQFFHVLRRQMLRPFRKPLIVMSPKSLLRHKLAVSTLDEFTNQDFQTVLDDLSITTPKNVRRVLLCSGKIYYTLIEARAAQAIKDVAIIRLEQLYPFPSETLKQILARYPQTASYAWVQDDPENMGAWFFVAPRLRNVLANGSSSWQYVGRAASASPAVGSYKDFLEEEQTILAEAFALPKKTTASGSQRPKNIAKTNQQSQTKQRKSKTAKSASEHKTTAKTKKKPVQKKAPTKR